MTKPWESNLFVAPCNHNDYCLSEDGDRMVAIFRRQEAEEWKAFLVAAPDMARALMALLPDDDEYPCNHTRECLKWRTDGGYITECLPGCIETMTALRKAGVPL